MQLISLFTDPRQVFTELDAKPSVLLPFLLMVVLAVAALSLYYVRVDPDWIVQATLTAGGQLSGKDLEQAAKYTSLNTLKWGSLAGVVIGSGVALLLMGAYYKLAGKIAGVERSYRQWLAFQAWSTLPMVLSSIVMLVGVALMGPRTLLLDLELTHIDPLLVTLAPGHPWKNLLTSIDLISLWSMFVVATGWQAWGGSRRGGIIVAVVPSLLLYGIWAIVLAVKH